MPDLEDQVEQVFATIEELRDIAGDGPGTRKLLDSLFRTVHNIKAAASSQELTDLGHAAHEFENFIHSLRTGKTTFDDEAYNFLTEKAGSLFENLGRDGELAASPIPSEIWNSLKRQEKHSLTQAIAEGASLFLVQANFDLADFDLQFQSLKERLSTTGEVISTAPKIDSEHAEQINFRILYARDARAVDVSRELSEIPSVSVEEIAVALPRHAATTRSATDSVRIDLRDLDHIISATHKLFRETTQLVPDDQLERLERSFLELSSQLVNLRMVPVGKFLQRAVRAGQSAAIATGKEVDFVIHGEDLLLDRSLCEAIADPLVHLIRNAVDHGIEDTAQRQQLGKNPRGTITIDASASQGQTRITVTDDGRGIDPAIVAAAAKRLGVLNQDASVDVNRCVRLLFRPGFSTALEVSGISGRGVGLDVVETQVEEAGGSIRVSSQLGKGSSFEIMLPVTFGLLDVVSITVSGQRYLIDANQVGSNENTERTIGLGTLLGHPKESRVPLHCEFDQNRLTLLVDEIGERQQALIRSLGSRGGRWFGVAGASELSDGSVVLLLDLPRLVLRTSPGET